MRRPSRLILPTASKTPKRNSCEIHIQRKKPSFRGVRRKYIQRFRYGLFYMVDEKADELIIMNIRHAARRWPWEPRE